MRKKFDFEFLKQEDLKKIHGGSLEILKEVGAKIPNDSILGILEENGAKVNWENKIAKFPESLVESMLELAIKNQNDFYSDTKNKDEEVKGWMIFNNSGDLIEYDGYKRKKAKLSDILKAIVFGNSLDFTERITHFVEPEEYKNYIDVIAYFLLFAYSKKRYFLSTIRSLDSARCIIEMAKTVEPDASKLANGRLLEYELLPVKNLEFAADHLEIAYEFAKNNIKIMAGHWCWMGYHTPMSYASALTLSNANLLAGITFLMLLNPRQLFLDYVMDIFTLNRHTMDSPSMGSPNQAVFAIAAKQIADFYGFRTCIANTGLTDSIENNFQSGFERGVTAALTIACGADLIALEGLAGANSGVSFEQLIVDNELLSYLNFIFNKKINVSDKTLRLDQIKKTGIGNNFMEEETQEADLMDVYWKSDIFSYDKLDDFKLNKSHDEVQKSIKAILHEDYPPTPVIDDSTLEKLIKIIEGHIEDKNILKNLKNELNLD
jgi:trimethylamine---corrinoid protein Co-methyltransferase